MFRPHRAGRENPEMRWRWQRPTWRRRPGPGGAGGEEAGQGQLLHPLLPPHISSLERQRDIQERFGPHHEVGVRTDVGCGGYEKKTRNAKSGGVEPTAQQRHCTIRNRAQNRGPVTNPSPQASVTVTTFPCCVAG